MSAEEFGSLDVLWAFATLDPTLVATTRIDAPHVTRKMRCSALVMALRYTPMPRPVAALRSYSASYFAALTEDAFNKLTSDLLRLAREEKRTARLIEFIRYSKDALPAIEAELARRAAMRSTSPSKTSKDKQNA